MDTVGGACWAASLTASEGETVGRNSLEETGQSDGDRNELVLDKYPG